MADQLVFDLPYRAAYNREDFLVSSSNVVAIKAIDALVDDNINPILILHGEASAGKTHLLNVWANDVGAVFLDLNESAVRDVLKALPQTVVIDDLDRKLSASDQASAALFHLLNGIKNMGGRVLCASRFAPKAIKADLPDLKSRLLAAQSAEIHAPDDTLLGALCLKHLHDRQLKIEPEALAYMLSRSNRSFDDILKNIHILDQASLIEKRRLTLPFIKKTLGF